MPRTTTHAANRETRTSLMPSVLVELFRRNGYVRRQNTIRLEVDGYWGYKKGDEVRVVAKSRAELAEVRRLLRAAGFKPGRPFRKAKQYCQPLYGREQVARFLALVAEQA